MTSTTIDIHGRHDTHRLSGEIDGSQNLAFMIDAAVKACRDLWHPVEAHKVDHGARADEADFEPDSWMNAGLLTATLVRTAAENGFTLDLIGADEPDADVPEAHVVLVQDELKPRTVDVQLEESGVQRFHGRVTDFVGWAKAV
ncbi:hypothetical protein [Rhodovibrio salinarum]|uniref:Uncharacterized protein n=1 Tax=Rhodovibrio salinarum TaxID=1087 RepID=A0A934QFT0_9PROT|nr:hypothetical protein [Rhodovibrio salinarum]MBK1696188.1 hypothetical protein [Rhodovibrio salinarum]